MGDRLVPDTVWGLSVKEACEIHDEMYGLGMTQFEKDIADGTFFLNMRNIIIQRSGKFFMRLRLVRAHTYEFMVKKFGRGAFFKGKEKQNA